MAIPALGEGGVNLELIEHAADDYRARIEELELPGQIVAALDDVSGDGPVATS